MYELIYIYIINVVFLEKWKNSVCSIMYHKSYKKFKI